MKKDNKTKIVKTKKPKSSKKTILKKALMNYLKKVSSREETNYYDILHF